MGLFFNTARMKLADLVSFSGWFTDSYCGLCKLKCCRVSNCPELWGKQFFLKKQMDQVNPKKIA